jgi:two-component system chemotaxis sensor kinase CheA
MHLLRNALDHGLESTQQRIQAGKPETGVIQLSANYEENQIAILIHDDGKGMDPEALRQIAVKKGVLSAERARELSDQDAMQLIFAPGFSTAEQITDISGRGVGLDVVRRNIEQVGGRIEVESQIGFGSTFRLLLPLTLATIQALLVQVDDEIMALPLSTTKEVLYVDPNELTLVGARWVTRVRGSVVPLLWLKQFCRPMYRADHGTKQLLAVLVNYKGDLIGFVVDRLIGEQEVVVKGLGEFFGQIRGVSGVTILGDGNLALIIDTVGLADMLLEDGYNATHINS